MNKHRDGVPRPSTSDENRSHCIGRRKCNTSSLALLLLDSSAVVCRGVDHYDNLLGKGYAQTAISTNVSCTCLLDCLEGSWR
jgi:hypothetical protein